MIRIGIVGLGATVSIAHYHALGYKKDPRCQITAVYDINQEMAKKWVSEHGLTARVCSSYEEMLELVDAVDLCTPNYLHYPQASQALQKGLHVMVEKPMAIGTENCRSLAEEADQSSKIAMVAMVYRYASAVRLARKIAKEQIGQVYTLTAWMGGKRLADPKLPMEWRMKRRLSGNGALIDFGSHLIDLADYVAGQRYEEVSCQTATFIDQRKNQEGILQSVENDDAAVFVARSGNGIGSFTVSRVGLDDMLLLITGEGGMLKLSMANPEQLTYWEKAPDGGYSGKIKQYEIEKQTYFEGWFDQEMKAFLDAIEGSAYDIAGIRQGLYVEEVLHAAEQSYLSRKTQEVRK